MSSTITNTERRILINQYRILTAVDPANATDYQKNLGILESGLVGMYGDVIEPAEEKSEEDYRETMDILDMFRVIDVAKKGTRHSSNMLLEFEGFDHHDDHYHIASLIVEEHGRWTERKGSLEATGGGTLDRYRRMLPVYKSLLKEIGTVLSEDQLAQLIKAAAY